MILLRLPWLVSMLPGTCFCRTKSARNSMKAFGGRGTYPWLRLFPGGTRFLVGGGAGVALGGNSGSGRSVVREGEANGDGVGDGAEYDTGVTFGANVTGACGDEGE
jgi:hypothetical protein